MLGEQIRRCVVKAERRRTSRKQTILSVVSQKPVVVVTGASAGVGKAVALSFARHGWRVALLARGRPRLEAVADEIRAVGAEALVLPTDVADFTEVAAAAGTVIGAWGKIDVWINNAMVTVFGPADSVEPNEFKRVTEVTYLGQVFGTKAAMTYMRKAGGGTVVCIGSALTYRSIPLQSAYCGAKAAVRGFVDALRCELLHENSPIKLTMVHLPAVNTEQFSWARSKMDWEPRPLAPVFTPEAVAEEIYKAAINPTRELWVGKPTVQTILAGLLLPGVTDRLAARKAFEGQFDKEPNRKERPDNLFDSVDLAVPKGRFGQESLRSVGSVSGAKARAAAAAFGIALVTGGVYVARYLSARR